MLDWIKNSVFYGIVIALIWMAIIYLPRFKTVAVSGNYTDVNGIDITTSYHLDATVNVNTLNHGDAICYQLAESGDQETLLGWVAGLPGDLLVSDDKGKLTVNGKPIPHGLDPQGPPYGPVIIPAGRFMVVTDNHQTDSLKNGLLPAIALRGRIGSLP